MLKEEEKRCGFVEEAPDVRWEKVGPDSRTICSTEQHRGI